MQLGVACCRLLWIRVLTVKKSVAVKSYRRSGFREPAVQVEQFRLALSNGAELLRAQGCALPQAPSGIPGNAHHTTKAMLQVTTHL